MPFEHADEIFFGFLSRYAESYRYHRGMAPNCRAGFRVGHVGHVIEMKRASNCVLSERVASPRKVGMDRLVERCGGQVRANIDAWLFS